MSYARRKTNPGKRERAARKVRKLKRTWVLGNMYADHAYFSKYPPEAEPLKLGRKKLARWVRNSLAVADTGTPGKSAP